MSLSAGRLVPGPLTTPNDLARTVVAVVCAGSAGAHAALVRDHLHESVTLAAAFVLDACLLAVAAVRVSDRRSAALPAGVVLLATAIAYVLSRTTGLPGVLPEPEPLDGLGVLTTSGELVGVVACLFLIVRKEQP